MHHLQSFLKTHILRVHTCEILIHQVQSRPDLCGFNRLPENLMQSQFSDPLEQDTQEDSHKPFRAVECLLWKQKKRLFTNKENPNSFLPWIFSYTGNRPASNMAIVDVKMVSGFIPLKPTVKMVGVSILFIVLYFSRLRQYIITLLNQPL